MPANPSPAPPAAAFWAWFTRNKPRLDLLDDPDELLWDEALAELAKVHPDLRFALSSLEDAPAGSPRELVITASCDTALFPVVDALVAAAPSLPGWTWVALKPPMGFDVETEYEDLALDAAQMWFFPIRDSARPRQLGLRIAVPGLTRRREGQYFDAVAMMLETALGEREAATDLHDLHVVPLPQNLKAEGYAPLKELSAYIAWNKANRLPAKGWSGIAEWKSGGGKAK
ncbi:MAG: hypothetical protein K2Q09_06105 [Phycisphaerales bacterium]|nr:hypothetical protein [Phycisphaerales bacterium]